METPGGTVSAAVREHLRQLCLREFPCGTGSWVRAPAGAAGGGTRGSAAPRGPGRRHSLWRIRRSLRGGLDLGV